MYFGTKTTYTIIKIKLLHPMAHASFVLPDFCLTNYTLLGIMKSTLIFSMLCHNTKIVIIVENSLDCSHAQKYLQIHTHAVETFIFFTCHQISQCNICTADIFTLQWTKPLYLSLLLPLSFSPSLFLSLQRLWLLLEKRCSTCNFMSYCCVLCREPCSVHLKSAISNCRMCVQQVCGTWEEVLLSVCQFKYLCYACHSSVLAIGKKL